MKIFIIPRAEGKKGNEVFLYDVIAGGSDSSAKSIIGQLRKLKGDIIVRINSRGGEIFEGMAIFSYLQSIDQKVITVVDGLAASIASIIAMAGDEVHIAENGYLMIHNPWTFGGGESKDMRKAANRLDKFAVTMREIYAEKTGLDIAEITELMDAETYMNAKESLEKKFVDQIVGKSEFKMVAETDLSDLPERVAAAIREATNKTQVTPPGRGVTGGNTMEELLLALGVTTQEEAMAAIGKLKADKLDLTSQKATLENRVTALNTRLGKLEEDNAVNLVDLAIAAGEILPKDKAVAETLLKADPEKFQNWKTEQKELMGIIRGDLNLSPNPKDNDELDIETR